MFWGSLEPVFFLFSCCLCKADTSWFLSFSHLFIPCPNFLPFWHYIAALFLKTVALATVIHVTKWWPYSTMWWPGSSLEPTGWNALFRFFVNFTGYGHVSRTHSSSMCSFSNALYRAGRWTQLNADLKLMKITAHFLNLILFIFWTFLIEWIHKHCAMHWKCKAIPCT